MLRMCGCALAAVCVAWMGSACGDELTVQGRAVVEKNQKAVVTVQLVIKSKFSGMGMGSQEQEDKSEATGVVIDPSGLTVLALSETDPSSMYESMISGMDMADKMKFSSSVGDVKLLLDDGTEVAARVVLRDKDLDLAFVRPETPPAQPLAAVDLTQGGEPQLLDAVISLDRLGRVANRTVAAGIEHIQAIIQKPRLLYVPGNDPTFSSLGSPMFTLDGKLVGITTMRTLAGGGRSPMGGMDDNMMAVLVPAADVLEAAKQAATAEPEPEPVDEAPAPEANPAPEASPEPAPLPGGDAPGATPTI